MLMIDVGQTTAYNYNNVPVAAHSRRREVPVLASSENPVSPYWTSRALGSTTASPAQNPSQWIFMES